jgi:protein-tyrosine sulfotransferase
MRLKKSLGLLITLAITCLTLYVILLRYVDENEAIKRDNAELRQKVDNEAASESHDLGRNFINTYKIRNMPIIFIGGFARSGTTLMRAILDVHPTIACGPETNALPTFLADLTENLIKATPEKKLNASGVYRDTIQGAAASFVYSILKNRRVYANADAKGSYTPRDTDRLCCKDPPIVRYTTYLHDVFPKAKFIYMIRDGRGSCFSLLNNTYHGRFTIEQFYKEMKEWNVLVKYINKQCEKVGPEFCHRVYYEDLVSSPEVTLRKIVNFLDETWTDDFLHHEDHFDDEIKISPKEWSSKQIKKKIYKDSLRPVWKNIKGYNPRDMKKYDMLETFGYTI